MNFVQLLKIFLLAFMSSFIPTLLLLSSTLMLGALPVTGYYAEGLNQLLFFLLNLIFAIEVLIYLFGVYSLPTAVVTLLGFRLKLRYFLPALMLVLLFTQSVHSTLDSDDHGWDFFTGSIIVMLPIAILLKHYLLKNPKRFDFFHV